MTPWVLGLCAILVSCAAGPEELIVGRWRYLGPRADKLTGEIKFTETGRVLTFFTVTAAPTDSQGLPVRQIVDQSYEVVGESVLIDDNEYYIDLLSSDQLILRDSTGHTVDYERLEP